MELPGNVVFGALAALALICFQGWIGVGLVLVLLVIRQCINSWWVKKTDPTPADIQRKNT